MPFPWFNEEQAGGGTSIAVFAVKRNLKQKRLYPAGQSR
jgi:hypothetical protein